ncbi:MAG: glycosyltransferase family 4 protein [Aurantibacter sp.]
MKPKLVILTTNFGTNFSGGARATCEVFSRIQDQFEKITVLGTTIGDHQFQNLEFIKVNHWLNTYRAIRKLEDDLTIFYGDFYNSFLFGVAQVPFIFTYHDNWPELARLNIKSRFQSLFFNRIYYFVFRKAKVLITVSDFKKKTLEKYAKKVYLIPNGFNCNTNGTTKDTPVLSQILMVGNIDDRKYALALKLFEHIKEHGPISIDIYGHVVNKNLAKKLSKYSFVSLKGFVKEVPYASYKLLLHTSFSESFGLVFYEAIFHRVPVLTFNIGGAPELISAENGRMVRAYDIEAMYDVLKKMTLNPIKANSETVTSFSWENTSSSYQNLFRDVG